MELSGAQRPIEIDDERNAASIVLPILIDEHPYLLLVKTDEANPQITVMFESPWLIPKSKTLDMAMLLNLINCNTNLGCFMFSEETKLVMYRWQLFVPHHLKHPESLLEAVGFTVHTGVRAFEKYASLIAECISTERSAGEVWSDFSAKAKG